MKTIAALILTTGLFANTASAADPHLDDLAFTLQQQAALACREVRYGFRNSPAFPHLYKDFYELYTLAAHVHEVAHNHGDLRHLKDDVDQMDTLFHHTEELTAQAATIRTVQGGRVYQVPACSNVSEYHLRRLRQIMVDMEDTLHHLQDDLEAEVGPAGNLPPVPPAQLNPAGPSLNLPPLPPVQQSPGIVPQPSRFPSTGYRQGRSVSFGGGNGKVAFTIRLGN